MALLFHGWKSLEGNRLGDIEVEELLERTPTTRQKDALEVLATREALAFVDEIGATRDLMPFGLPHDLGTDRPERHSRPRAGGPRGIPGRRRGEFIAAVLAGPKLQAVQPVPVTPRSAGSAPSRREKLIPQRSRRTR